MTFTAIALWSTVGVLAVGSMALAFGYNRLVVLRNRCRNGFSQIDVQLKRRHDLIPSLVEVCKGYMAHERQTLENVTRARSAAVDARAGSVDAGSAIAITAVGSLLNAESSLTGALGSLLARVEAYPNLKADKLASQLFEQLATTENRIAFARQAYNDAVMVYRSTRESFPTLVYAGTFGFADLALWQIDAAVEREAVPVKLS
jgi:LemA protein